MEIYCYNCDYNLHGLGAGRCPECGTYFDPARVKTFYVKTPLLELLRGGRFVRSPIWWSGWTLGTFMLVCAANEGGAGPLFFLAQEAFRNSGPFGFSKLIVMWAVLLLVWAIGNGQSKLLERAIAIGYFLAICASAILKILSMIFRLGLGSELLGVEACAWACELWGLAVLLSGYPALRATVAAASTIAFLPILAWGWWLSEREGRLLVMGTSIPFIVVSLPAMSFVRHLFVVLTLRRREILSARGQLEES